MEEVIKKIDASDSYGLLSDIKLYSLEQADATRLATALQQFFTSKRAAETAAGGDTHSLAVTITADERTNTLLVAGSPESFKAVDDHGQAARRGPDRPGHGVPGLPAPARHGHLDSGQRWSSSSPSASSAE